MREVHAEAAPVADAGNEVGALKIRLAREKKARAAAEVLLEAKSEELYERSQELAHVLSSSVKIMADVLALARPELFQKGAKIQRWVGKVSPLLKVERPWELNLAAMLCPLGIIALPDELVAKYAQALPLSDEEQLLIDESPGAAHALMVNMPRMEGVANTIYYSRKNFDGTGYPYNEVSGEKLPQAARILRVLLDLADFATGEGNTRAEAFAKMAEFKSRYDLEILKVAYNCLNKAEETQDGSAAQEIDTGSLLAGDILQRDIVDSRGRLMLASGAELTNLSITRLQALDLKGDITGKIAISRAPEKTK